MPFEKRWHLAVRTAGQSHPEWGTMDNLSLQAADEGQPGVFAAFRNLKNVQAVKLQSGSREAVYVR